MAGCLILFAFAGEAKSGVNVLDDSLKSKVMQKSAVSDEDLRLYKEIFAAIRNNKIKEAEDLQKKLKSDVLKGHILAQKYLSREYKSSYKELMAWQKKYPSLPQYEVIKNLAKTKAPGYKPPKPSQKKKGIYAPYKWYREKYEKLTPADRKFVRDNLDVFLSSIRRTDNKKALEVMQNERFRKTIPDKNYDEMSATLAASYFYDGEYEKALQQIEKAVRRSKEPTAAWFGGLSAWKLGNYQKAASMFEKLFSFHDEDLWLHSAAGYWAYRANLKLGKKEQAEKYLKKTAEYKRTFYGILANAQLREIPSYDWEEKAFFNDLQKQLYHQEILSSTVMRRAVLLLMLGENDLAEADLRKNYNSLNLKQKELAMFLSSQYSLANLSFIIANGLKNYGKKRFYDAFLYPYPDWKPQSGWKINRSWVWALVRQESLFSPKVKSHAGACGLMQIMPATAAGVTKDKKYKEGCKLLLDKKRNLQIGQDYVDILLNKEDKIGDNLFFLAASYNGGPHNVRKWIARENYDNDPLMFVEMIPWRETRLYVKKVVANYWIYNARRGKKSQSLKQLIKGKWPRLD